MQFHIILRKLQSICREDVYSFSEAIMDFSTGLDVLALGLTIVSKPDDLNAYFQVPEAFLVLFTFHVYKSV